MALLIAGIIICLVLLLIEWLSEPTEPTYSDMEKKTGKNDYWR